MLFSGKPSNLEPKPKSKSLSSEKFSLSIIVVTHKNNKIMAACLKSLLSSKVPPSEIIVVDNASPNPPRNIIYRFFNKRRPVRIRYFENKKNFGFAKAVNRGVRLANGEYILLINPDFFIDKFAISVLERFIKDKKDNKVIVGGRVFDYKTGNIQKTAIKTPCFLTLLIEFTSLKKLFDKCGLKDISGFWDKRCFFTNSEIEVDVVSGCFLLINKAGFEDLNGFDENFFLYLEDADLCIRAKREGFSIFYLPGAKGRHISGASSDSKPNNIDQASWDKSKRYFSTKHFSFGGHVLSSLFTIDDFLIKIKRLIFK